MDKITAKLLEEINICVRWKLLNIQNGTATEKEKQTVQECLGYLSLIRYSCLKPAVIKRCWDNSGLAYM